MTVQAAPGTREAALRYLTPGLGWRADYVALYDETASKHDVQGWIVRSLRRTDCGARVSRGVDDDVAGNCCSTRRPDYRVREHRDQGDQEPGRTHDGAPAR